MLRKTLIYGAILALLMLGLKLAEYRFVMYTNATEIYAGIVAILFTILGVITGRKLADEKEVREVQVIVEKLVPIQNFQKDVKLIEQSGISKRELEVLELIAQGLSNQEIAAQTFVSIHTVKTHVSNLFIKLDVKRRTQAVVKAKELGLIP